jgi:hypothetical protein
MSLASRVINAIFPDQSVNITPNERNLNLRNAIQDIKTHNMEEKEAEGRPPYIHVSFKIIN